MFRAYAALILVGFIWGSNFIYMKMATAAISPLQVVFLRVAAGFVPLALMAWKTGVLNRGQLRHLPHFAVMSVLATSFYYYGFAAGTALLPSGVAGLLGGAIPIVTFLTSLIFLRSERPNRLMAAGVGVGFAGIVLAARPWEGGATVSLAGVLWVMTGVLSVGVSFVWARRFLSPLGLPPLALATWQTGLGLITLAAVTDYRGMTAILDEPHALAGLILGLGVLGTGLAYLIYYYILDRLGAVGASGATYLPAVVALAIGAAVGETVTAVELLALALILGGVALIQLGSRRVVRRPPAVQDSATA
ncbi:DMT family transporter [Pseudogemmobacter humi]|uniref:DMT family transporter n=1 Tax=Pseudogemmobacter humi TaxID=2483812 RepID=UPI000F542DA7|nr:DMT family transporter [Pseudogemmobacter humi]